MKKTDWTNIMSLRDRISKNIEISLACTDLTIRVNNQAKLLLIKNMEILENIELLTDRKSILSFSLN